MPKLIKPDKATTAIRRQNIVLVKLFEALRSTIANRIRLVIKTINGGSK